VPLEQHLIRAGTLMNRLLSQMSLWVIALLTCMPRVGEWKMLLEWFHRMATHYVVSWTAMFLGYVKSVRGQKA
jgi:hypothetical protein